jgi:hypothetical protein
VIATRALPMCPGSSVLQLQLQQQQLGPSFRFADWLHRLRRFMTKDGRISMAGLNSARAEYLAQAIDDSVRNF